MDARRPRAWLALALALAPARAAGHVLFTGYADARAIPYARYLGGPVAAFPSANEHFVNPGFRLDSIGLFAASAVDEDMQLLVDLSFKGVGATAAETRLQYAYLDTALPWGGLRAQVGKVNLPLNRYNERRFYPFQRAELTPPFAIANALGLPIADVGVVLRRSVELPSSWQLEAAAYGVNGYGSVPASTDSLRSPALPGGLGLGPNLRASNNNKDVAWGGRLMLCHERAGEAGVSYYRGAWDPDGRRLLQLAGAHLLWTPGRLDLLVEYLHIHARGDQGMALAFGSTSWCGHGVFATASHPLLRVDERELTGYGRFESYASGRVGGGPGKEVLRSAAGGLSFPVVERATLKAEYYWVRYALPLVGRAGLEVEGRAAQAALVVTF